jgi:DNA-binding FadR family transcriptional regulator
LVLGEIAPGSALPSERVLAERFGVSRTVLRQAVHKLEECGLVAVRQGGATVALDAALSTDYRVLELRYRLGPKDGVERRELAERRILQGHALVYLAERRADPAAVVALLAQVESYLAEGAPDDGLSAFERTVWEGLASLAENRLYRAEVAWWFRVAGHGTERPEGRLLSPMARASFYRELFRRLRDRDHAARFFMDMMGPLLARGDVFG